MRPKSTIPKSTRNAIYQDKHQLTLYQHYHALFLGLLVTYNHRKSQFITTNKTHKPNPNQTHQNQTLTHLHMLPIPIRTAIRRPYTNTYIKAGRYLPPPFTESPPIQAPTSRVMLEMFERDLLSPYYNTVNPSDYDSNRPNYLERILKAPFSFYAIYGACGHSNHFPLNTTALEVIQSNDRLSPNVYQKSFNWDLPYFRVMSKPWQDIAHSGLLNPMSTRPLHVSGRPIHQNYSWNGLLPHNGVEHFRVELQRDFDISMALLMGGYSTQRRSVMLNQYPEFDYLRSHWSQIQSFPFLPVLHPDPTPEFKREMEKFYLACKIAEHPWDAIDYHEWFDLLLAPTIHATTGLPIQ